jgi:hypothetical protein
MTANEFRRIALGMQGAVEGAHMAHPDFRANGRIFATIAPDALWGMVKLSSEQQQEFLSVEPETFVPAKGAWGRSGCTMVQFATADSDTVGEAMTLAWQGTVKSAKSKSKSTEKPRPKPKARPEPKTKKRRR